MSKLFYLFTASFSLLSCQYGFSQSSDSSMSKSQEIIIRKNGGKETTINIQIDDDNVIINGKPLMEFNQDGISIHKRKMRIHDGNPGMEFRRRFNREYNGDEGMNRTMEETIDSTTFLGVTTDYSEKGATIIMVSQGSAAEKAGLTKDDIITRINKEKIKSPEDLSEAIKSKKPKETVEITFIRDGKEKKVTAELQLKKRVTRKTIVISDRMVQGSPYPQIKKGFPLIPSTEEMDGNIILENITGEPLDMNNMDVNVQVSKKPKIGLKIRDRNEGNGVQVLEVTENSAAASAGILENDIITGIGGKEVNNTDDARELLKMAEQSSSFNVDLLRNGKKMNIKVSTPKKIKTADL